MKRKASGRAQVTVLCAGFVALLSQVSVAVQSGGFHISVALVLFQILLFALPVWISPGWTQQTCTPKGLISFASAIV